MPRACTGDTYVRRYSMGPRFPLFRVPGGGFAAAGNAEQKVWRPACL